MGNNNSTTEPGEFIFPGIIAAHYTQVQNDQQTEPNISAQNNSQLQNDEYMITDEMSTDEGQPNGDADETIDDLNYSDEGSLTMMGYMDEDMLFDQMFENDANVHTDEGDCITQSNAETANMNTKDMVLDESDNTNDQVCNAEITEVYCDENDDEKEILLHTRDEIKPCPIDEEQICNAEPCNVRTHHRKTESKTNVLNKPKHGKPSVSLNPNAGEFHPKNKVCIDTSNKLSIIYEHMELTEFKESQQSMALNVSKIVPNYKARMHNVKINDGRDRTPRPLKIGNTQPLSKQKISAIFEYTAYQKHYSAIKISKEATKNISNRIRENISHLYNHIVKTMSMQKDNEFALGNGTDIKIINFGVHDRTTNESLYAVAEAGQPNESYKWVLFNRAFTANEIKIRFHICCEQLPKLWTLHRDFQPQLKYPEKIRSLMQNDIDIVTVINKAKWTKRDKVQIYNTKSNAKRRTLSLSKQEFLKQFNEYMTCDEYKYNQELIPIVMPGIGDKSHEMQFVQVIKLNNTDIFVAFRYEQQSNSIKVCGIHLDPAFILSQHQLLYPGSTHDSLECFQCDFDHLFIGNPDSFENNMNYYKNRCDKFTKFVRNSQKYFSKMVRNTANITSENIEIWIDKSRIVCKNNKNGANESEYLLDLSILLNKNVQSKSSLSTPPQTRLYIQQLQHVNNWYFQQTLNPILKPIMPHPMHKQTCTSPQMKLRITL